MAILGWGRSGAKQFLAAKRDKALEPPWVFLCTKEQSHVMSYKPPAALDCWGLKYQDGDKECGQCKFNESCRPAMLNRIVNPSDQRTSLPVLRNYSPSVSVPPPPPTYQQQSMVPMPSRPYFPPPANTIPLPRTVPLPSQPTQQAPQQQAHQAPQVPQYYQQSTGWSLPSNSNPNPMAPMFRPGAPSPAYYFTQYPTESVASRIGKNILLRAAEAIFGELMQFFRHWTWPPR